MRYIAWPWHFVEGHWVWHNGFCLQLLSVEPIAAAEQVHWALHLSVWEYQELTSDWEKKWWHILPCWLKISSPACTLNTFYKALFHVQSKNDGCGAVVGIPGRDLCPSAMASWWSPICACLEEKLILTLHRCLLYPKTDHYFKKVLFLASKSLERKLIECNLIIWSVLVRGQLFHTWYGLEYSYFFPVYPMLLNASAFHQ